MSATNTRPLKSKRLSLMGLPAELRGLIFEELFRLKETCIPRPCFTIRDGVFNSFYCHPSTTPITSILRTSRALLDEGLDHIYSRTELHLLVADQCHRTSAHRDEEIVENLEELHIWPYVKKLRVYIGLWKTDRETVIRETICHIIAAVEGGKNLNSLKLVVDWRHGYAVPQSFDVVLEALERFDVSHLHGDRVGVSLAGDMEDDEKEMFEDRLERSIRGL